MEKKVLKALFFSNKARTLSRPHTGPLAALSLMKVKIKAVFVMILKLVAGVSSD